MFLDWKILRAEEGRGFVSNRIAKQIISKQALIYGEVFYIEYGKFCRILNPWDVVIRDNIYDVKS